MSEIKLPDFDDMLRLSDEIGGIIVALEKSKISLDIILAYITRKSMIENEFFVNGKPPSMAYIAANYHILGLDEETREKLLVIREKIANLTGELETLKGRFNTYRAMVDAWKAEQFNKRQAEY